MMRIYKSIFEVKKIIYDFLFLLSITVFMISAYKLISIYYLNYQEGKEKDAVQEVAKVPKNLEKEEFTIDWKACSSGG
ncbi:MAG: hypothetical protein ACLRY6_22740 [[Clostridium] innocuum]